MAKVITDSKHYAEIAAAIRAKNGQETQYKPSEMAAAIEAIEAGAGSKRATDLKVYEYSHTFSITYEDGTGVTGSVTFDENGLPTSLTDDSGNAVTFAAGYPTGAKDSEGNAIPITWE